MKLQTKIWFGATAVIATIMSVDAVIGYRGIERGLRAGLDDDARIVRAMLMATRRVYHQQFMASGLPVTDKTVGFLPAHALSRISREFPEWTRSKLRFNNVSDRARNPGNKADRHELAAMDWFRAHPKAVDRVSEFSDDAGRAIYHFTAPIWIEPYCLTCHGDRASAPATIRASYTDGFGYKLGDLRGMLSIKLPMDELRAETFRHWKSQYALRAGGYAILLLLLGALLQRLVVHPVRHLQGVAQRIGMGDLSARATLKSNDEIAQLGKNFNDMAEALAGHEREIARLNDIYAALSETNQTIVRIGDPEELLRRICRIAVEFGGMKMAWIARRDTLRNILVPIESHGSGVEFLNGLRIDLDPAGPDARGPTALAYTGGVPVIVQDFFADASTAPWHERARPYGWGAAAAFPVRRGGNVHLVFNLYHPDRDALDTKVVELLGEMVIDIGFALDRFDLIVSEEKTRDALEASETKYRNVVATSQDGFWLVDDQGSLLEVNNAYLAFSGYSRDELISMCVADLDALENAEEITRRFRKIKETGGDLYETQQRTKCGAIKVVEISVSVSNRNPPRFSVFIRDLSQRNEAEQRIQRLSHFDTLTGLPNRSLFGDLIRLEIEQAARNREPLALIYIDLDNFKHVNDTLSHRIGDLLLVAMAERFQHVLRTDGTLSRLGGDEFIILLPHVDAEGAAHVAERLIVAASEPILVENNELSITPSLGIALYPSDGEDFETLLSKADTATHRAKQDGRATYRFFTPEMQARSVRALKLEAALRRAIERDELVLHYQPQIDLRHGRLVGAEALIRWHHPELGMITPAEFIPLAESTGLILPIGEWVLRTALRQVRAWNELGLDLPVVAVNLSVVQFRQENLVDSIQAILAEEGVEPRHLELELTESLMMDHPVAAIAMMDALHLAGIQLSIDDFGTGYSSLNYLKRFHIDKLKIDQSFVRDLTHDPEGEAIVRAIISLANSLKFHTIAEGVETEAQLGFLRGVCCDEVQGYLFARPMPAEELIAWVRAWHPEMAAGCRHQD